MAATNSARTNQRARHPKAGAIPQAPTASDGTSSVFPVKWTGYSFDGWLFFQDAAGTERAITVQDALSIGALDCPTSNPDKRDLLRTLIAEGRLKPGPQPDADAKATGVQQ